MVVLVMFRSVREDLDGVRGQEGGKEEDGDTPEDAEPGLQRDVHFHRAVRAHTPHQPGHQRHGPRPHHAVHHVTTDHVTGSRDVMDHDRLGRNDKIGQLVLSSKSGAMEMKHWNEMFAKSRQAVAKWHILKDFG